MLQRSSLKDEVDIVCMFSPFVQNTQGVIQGSKKTLVVPPSLDQRETSRSPCSVGEGVDDILKKKRGIVKIR